MADFCRACSVDVFGEDTRDLARITTQQHWQEGRAANVICEGCGPIQVDPEGNCVSHDCGKAGEQGHNWPWRRVILRNTVLLPAPVVALCDVKTEADGWRGYPIGEGGDVASEPSFYPEKEWEVCSLLSADEVIGDG